MKVEIPGAEIACDDAGTGLPVVLLHGFPLSRSMWRPQVEALSARWRVIVPDLRGFGGSSPFDGPPSVDRAADDVAALLDSLRVAGPVVIGGLSMGGYVALAFARRHPARLHALILADTRAEADDDAGRAAREELLEFAKDHTAREVIDRLLPKMVSEETQRVRPEVVEEVRRIAEGQPVPAIQDAIRMMRDRPDATPGLAAIGVPTLVVVGAEDVLTPPELSRRMAAGIRGARLEIIPGAGHLASMEEPALFGAALRSFLDETSSGS